PADGNTGCGLAPQHPQPNGEIRIKTQPDASGVCHRPIPQHTPTEAHMGHLDFACSVHTPYVDALHDTLHDSVPLVSPSEAVREVRAALLSSDRTAFEYSREAWIEAFLNMPEEDLGKLL